MDGRLKQIYTMAGVGDGVADIGTDHGYLVCALVEDGKARFGLACDINPGPLRHARAEIARRGLSDRITPVLTDGLCNVPVEGLDRVVIAGMGGELIARILGDWTHAHDPGIAFLLQPMTRAETLRRWLWENGYSIFEERCCTAAGRVYSVLRCGWSGAVRTPTARELFLGAIDPARDPLAAEYRRRVVGRITRQIVGLAQTESPENARRARELLALTQELEEGSWQQ